MQIQNFLLKNIHLQKTTFLLSYTYVTVSLFLVKAKALYDNLGQDGTSPTPSLLINVKNESKTTLVQH